MAHSDDQTPNLKPNQERALDAILTGATDREAADAAGVRRETVNRWRNLDPYFVAELRRRRRELWDGQRDALRSLLPRAVKVLENALADSDASTRLRAAALVLRTLAPGEDAFEPGPAVAPHIVADQLAARHAAGVL